MNIGSNYNYSYSVHIDAISTCYLGQVLMNEVVKKELGYVETKK